MIRAVECRCGELHIVRWNPRAAIDGAWEYVCTDDGRVELHHAYRNPPGRIVTDIEEESS